MSALDLVDSVTSQTPLNDFALLTPGPSSPNPWTLNVTDATQVRDVVVEFSPVDRGPGQEQQFGFAIVTSNDLTATTDSPPATLSLRGEALRSALAGSPASCDFDRASDLCGNPTKIVDRARFTLRNDGNAALRLSQVQFRSTGAATSPRFSLVTNPVGQTIAVGRTFSLEVTHASNALSVLDELTLRAVFWSGGSPAGSATFALQGGVPPCLDAPTAVNFNNPTAPVSVQSFAIANQRRFPDGGTSSAGCGALVLGSVSLAPSPAFRLLPPLVSPGMTLNPGGQQPVSIEYTRPVSGGRQVTTLAIDSNDFFFGPPPGRVVVNVVSASAFDPPPQCVLTGCVPSQLINDPTCSLGTQTTLQVNLSSIPGAVRTMTVSGVNSTDFDGITLARPTEFRFQLLSPIPAGATAGNLSPNVRGTTDRAVLVLPAIGLYRVTMGCFDSRGQAGQPASLNVNVLP